MSSETLESSDGQIHSVVGVLDRTTEHSRDKGDELGRSIV